MQEGGIKHALSVPLPELEVLNRHQEGKAPEDANVKGRIRIYPGLSRRFYEPKFNEPLTTFKIKTGK